MSKHAGFAAAAWIPQFTINEAIASYVRGKLGPFFFPMPQTIAVGQTIVRFAGIVEALPPTVEAHVNPANRVTVRFVLRTAFRGQIGNARARRWVVEWRASVDLAPMAWVEDGWVIIGIDTSTVVFQPLTVLVLEGPAMPPVIRNALESPQLAAAATAFVQGLPPLVASPPLLRSNLSFSQKGKFPDKNKNQTPWFVVTLAITRIVIRPLEGGLAIGIDLTGTTPVHTPWGAQPLLGETVWSTAGDESALTNLGKEKAPIYVYDTTVLTDPAAPPLLRKMKNTLGNVRISVNMEVIWNIVGKQVTPQVKYTLIAPGVVLNSVSAGYGTFDQPYSPWPKQDGLQVGFNLTLLTANINVTGRFIIQAYVRVFDGPTHLMTGDTWHVYVGKVEAKLPPWVNAAAIVFGIALGVAVPALAPLVAVALIGLLDGVIPTLIENAESQAQQGLNASAVSFEAWTDKPLPGLTKPLWTRGVRNVSFTPESVDTSFAWMVASYDKWLDEAPGAILPASWPATDTDPLRLSVKLRDDLENMAGPNALVRWEVRAADTGALIVSGVRPYNASGGNGFDIPHHSEALYYVNAFRVRCVVTLTLGSQVGEIWSGERVIEILDAINRYHRFMQWGPHYVYISNPATGEWWDELRTSRIHRTAARARCAMLKRRFTGPWKSDWSKSDPMPKPVKGVKMFDTLPFDWADLNQHRKPLCEFCFFGGPDKHKPFPQEDWF